MKCIDPRPMNRHSVTYHEANVADRPAHPTLPYESPAASPPPHSRYGILAVVVLGTDFLWFFVGVLTVSYSESAWALRIFCAAWLLGLFATIAAYSAKGCSQTLAHIAFALLAAVFLLTCLLPTF